MKSNKIFVTVIPIVGDGNCLFRSLSFALNRTENDHKIIRTTIVNYICEHFDLHEITLNDMYAPINRTFTKSEYTYYMGQDRQFGTTIEAGSFGEIYS